MKPSEIIRAKCAPLLEASLKAMNIESLKELTENQIRTLNATVWCAAICEYLDEVYSKGKL